MTLPPGATPRPPQPRVRRRVLRQMRRAEVLILILAAGAIAWAILGVGRYSTGLVWLTAAPAFLVILLTLVHVGARVSRDLESSRYLGLLSVVLGMVIAMAGIVMQSPLPARAATFAFGAAIALVATIEAWISWPSDGADPGYERTRARRG